MTTNVICTCVIIFFLAGVACGDDCLQTDPPDPANDVRFEITIWYYDFNPVSGYGETVETHGPEWDALSAPERRVGDLNPRLQVSNASVTGAGDGRVDVSLSNIVKVLARRVDGHIFGNGAAIRIAVWIKGPIGTPYYLRAHSAGTLLADFPDGAGVAETFFSFPFDAACCSATAADVSGAQPQELFFDYNPVVPDDDTPWVTTGGPERVIDGRIYSLAREVTFDGHGGIWQSLNFCFPSCPVVLYQANTIMSSGYIEAGVPKCSGTLDIVGGTEHWRENADGSLSVEAVVAITAAFQSDPPEFACRCCRYRQFVVDTGSRVVRDVHGHGQEELSAPSGGGGPDPCSGSPAVSCFLEDTFCEPACSYSGRVAYGDRYPFLPDCPKPQDGTQYLDEPGGTLDFVNGCFFEGRDNPGYGAIPVPIDDEHLEFRLDARFVSRIVDVCGSEERVVAQQDWSVCFAGSVDTNGLETTPCARAGARDALAPRALGSFAIAGRQATIVLVQDGDLILGSVGLPVVEGDSLYSSDVQVSIPDGTDIQFPDEPLVQFVRALGSTWVMPFAATRTNTSPRVDVMIEFEGDVVLLTLDLCREQRRDVSRFVDCLSGPGIEIGPNCACLDFDGDQDVDLVDYGGFQAAFTGNLGDANLIQSSPGDQASLWRTAGNVIRLTFDKDVATPTPGQIVIQELLDDGAFGLDLSSNGFSFTLENDIGGNPRVLKIREDAGSLTHRKWYAIRNTPAWTAVNPFEVQYVVQVGDVNADGKVLANDLSAIFPKIPTPNAGDQERADVNGDGKVLANDLSAVFPRIPSNTVPKPSGH